jgi:hypothetical protein
MNRLLRLLLAPFEQPEIRWNMPDTVKTWDNIRPTTADRVADAIKAGEYLTLPENPEQG